jgi:hypothetical protein
LIIKNSIKFFKNIKVSITHMKKNDYFYLTLSINLNYNILIYSNFIKM